MCYYMADFSCGNSLTTKMPKVRRKPSLSADQPRASAYPEQCIPEEQLESANDVKEWEEARCPICMEHPHNAVLLMCSSHEKGCRPYMCNTSYRHSNCLDQFCKSFAPHASITLLQEIPLTSTDSQRREDGWQHGQTMHCGSPLQPKLVCPLCRGEIHGYIIVEPARNFMNSKGRSCSSETCDFTGTYSELRKHARSEHPSVRPSEVDPMRQSDWTRLESERIWEDVLSSLHPEFGEETSEEHIFSAGLDDFAVFHFEFLILSILLNYPSDGEQLHNRRSGRMSRVDYDYDLEASPIAGRNNNLLSDSMPQPRQIARRANDYPSRAIRGGSNSSARVPLLQQTSGWSSESNSHSSSSQSRSYIPSYSRPRFRQMPAQSSGSMRSYPRQFTENLPHSRRLHWRGERQSPYDWRCERWSPYNNRR